jgi:hypothetical protein
MKTLRPWLLVGLLIGLLTACSSDPAPEVRLENLATQLLGINGKNLIEPKLGNCPIDDLRVPGERPRANGSTGGIAVLNATYPSAPGTSTLTDPSSTATYVKSTAALYGTPSRNVALLVLDDFGAGVYRLGKEVYELQTLPFTTADAVSRAIEIEGKLNALQRLGKLSHGALVLNHSNALLVTGGYSVAARSTAGDTILFKNPSTGSYVYVKAVNTEGFDTSRIAPKLEAALREVRILGYKSVAINMSFAIVPCSVRNDFAANRASYPTFESYARRVAIINSVPLDTVFRTIRQPVTPDPLYTLIQAQQPAGETRVYVAASGNYGLVYPMYPAAWPEVISVSSNDAKPKDNSGAGPSTFSNKGDIMITGAWFRLTNPAALNGSFGDAPNVAYAGTSFAAPAISVFTAYDLANAAPRCALQRLRPTLPDLSYGLWANTRLQAATTLYCPR